MNIVLVSLAVLVVAILIGFFRRMNVGLIAVLAVTIFASFISATDKDAIKGFPSSLFTMLLGVFFLCAVRITNGSPEFLVKKVSRLSGGHVFIAPIMLYLIGYGITAIGPGRVPTLGIVTALSLLLAETTGYSPTMLAIIGEMGPFAGRSPPITPKLALIREFAVPQGIQDCEIGALIYATIMTITLALATYFWLRREKKSETVAERESIPHFNSKQLLTLAGFAVLVVGSVFFKRNVGLLALAIGISPILVRAADEKKIFQAISWSTLLMVTGFGMLMNIMILVGGVELLSNALASVMISKTATVIQGLIVEIISWPSSAIGAAWPTTIPTVGSIVTNVGVSPVGLISIMCPTASFAGLSPISTGDGLIMVAASSDPDFGKEKENKLSLTLSTVSAVCLFLFVLAAFLGLYSILG